MNLPKFKVVQGIIYINHIDVMHCSEDALVFSIETKQKYPELHYYSSRVCTLMANERTLHVDDPEAEHTKVEFNGWVEDELIDGYWVFTTESKYCVRIALIKVKLVAQFVDTDQFADGSL